VRRLRCGGVAGGSFASVSAGDAMVAWLAVTKQGRHWRHGGVAIGASYFSLSLAGGNSRKRKARVDDPIRPSGVFLLRLVSITTQRRAWMDGLRRCAGRGH
jgi:hypothetical protein